MERLAEKLVIKCMDEKATALRESLEKIYEMADRGVESRYGNVSRRQRIISHSSQPTDPSKNVEFCCLTCYGFSFVCQDSLRYGRIDDKD